MTETEYKSVPIEENGKKKDLEDNPKNYGFGVRHIQGVIAFLGIALGYVARGHLGITIVAMTVDENVTNATATTQLEKFIKNTTTDLVNGTDDFKNITTLSDVGTNFIINHTLENAGIYRTFNWSKSTQEMVHGSFFLGYFIMMFPMGMICQRWGGIIPLQISMFVNSVLSFLTPWLLNWGDYKMLCIIRLVQGLSQSGLYPSATFIISSWVPVSERARLSSFVYTGSGVGTIIAFQLGGILGFSKFGWPSMFWVTGVICLIGFIFITYFGAASPMVHKSITEAERNYILGEIRVAKTNKKVPWKSIFSSIPTWSTFIAQTGNAICFIYVFIQVPTYMHSILKLNIRNSGVLSSLPYIASFFSSIVIGFASDFLTNRNIIITKTARRLSNSVGCVIPALSIIIVSYTTNTAIAVTFLILAMASNAAVHTGWFVNYVDLSPNYSGSLMAIGNTLTNIFIIMLPIMVSYIVTDVTNQLQWRITIFLVAGISVVCNTIFVIFMSSEVQPWDNSDDIINNEAEAIQLKSQEKQLITEKAETL